MHFVKAKGILSQKNFMNLYRGCTHGCIYCDSRSDCYQITHDFEDIEVKENAIELLEDALSKKRKKCMISTSSMCDPYLPLEETLCLTRRAIETVERFGFGFTCITKSARVLRDADLFQKINAKTKCVVQMTLTTFDDALSKKLEPHVSPTSERIRALKTLHGLGIPTVVWLCPLLPYINDTEENIAGILNACADAGVYGVVCFGIGMTLRAGNREYYYKALDRLFPGLSRRYEKEYGYSYHINSPEHAKLWDFFQKTCDELGLICDNDAIFRYLETFEEKRRFEQISLF